jgi:hypothetical protein
VAGTEAMALAALAGRTVVAAATTDAWGKAKQELARLLGRGDPDWTAVAERRLEETRGRLVGVPGADADAAGAAQARAWQVRVEDLLEEDAGLEAALRTLIDEVQSSFSPEVVEAGGHGVAAGRDVQVSAFGGGVAVGTVHGKVTAGNPTRPGLTGR